MRISTSSIYNQQSTAIDNLEAQYQIEGESLSTGKQLNAPSDDPTQIGEDLGVHTTIAVENQQATNIQAATAQLTATDSALANLTSVVQSAQQLATRGASDLLSQSERGDIGAQVDQLLQQAIAISNTQYGGTYVFGGSIQSSQPPVTTTGSPVSAVLFNGNEQEQTPMTFNGQTFSLSPTLQQAFNFDSTNGSPSVFGTLINLRDTLTSGTVTDESAQSINHSGDVIYGAASPAAVRTTLGTTPSPFAVQPTPDSTGNYTISINNTDARGVDHVNAYTFSGATVLDDATATSITGQINAQNGGPNPTGLSATWDAQSQRLTLSNAGGGAFSVTDEPSAGATGTSNFTQVFALAGSATLAQTVSTQLGDISNALNVTLNARSLIGSRINALAQINTQVTTDVLNNTSVKSNIEDTNIPKATTQFTLTQTALTAAYSTTTRLESKDLFDYL
jgi:flagellar hook-associated protein 3 FlgL